MCNNIKFCIYTKQVTKLFSGKGKKITWSAEDISSAIALRSLNGRTYKYLREVK